MQRGQPTVMFSFTILVAVLRVFAYGGTPVGEALSPAALVEFVVLNSLAFALAALLVVAMSRATLSRAAHVALYAQALLFLAPFVDVGLGLSIASYEDTYVAGIGSPGALLGDVGFAAVVAWGVWDASVGTARARRVNAGVAAVLALAGMSLLAVPWLGPVLSRGCSSWACRSSRRRDRTSSSDCGLTGRT